MFDGYTYHEYENLIKYYSEFCIVFIQYLKNDVRINIFKK